MSGTDDKPRGGFFDSLRVRTVSTDVSGTVPRGLKIATAYAWRFLVLAAAIAVLVWIVIQLRLLIIPLLAAILVTALVWPLFSLLLRRLPRWLSLIITLLLTVSVIAGLLWVAIWQITRDAASVRDRTVAGIGQFRDFLIEGPLHLTGGQIDDAVRQGFGILQEQAQLLWSGALAIGSTLGHVATGILLTLFILICVLADGAGIWRWVVRLFPTRARSAVDGAGRAGWRTVITYARTQLLVATIDAIGIGVGAALLGVPLAAPIGVLVFLGAFVPFVGAVLTGALAVFLALVYNGPWIALWMLVIVLGVQQVEGHILQPLLMGAAVKVHPLAVVLAVAGGAMVAGIAGAVFAVPLAAFVNVVWLYLSRRGWERPVDPGPDDLIWSTVPRARRTTA
ncbi:putative PurR-regulated permease PerM [Microbacterium sp. SORGH_AS 505]|uniref:AI-2E family transporter n=1 Tax=Microbacterium oleivorans TaxID=273677 RepID=A0A4R5YG81_9MICO|nr:MULTISPECIES: AI-2E family transporter [Microbacterium]MDQ1127742.1 putative PurR-regulated permease PerM [Microbacterium sp. SORGH_AS_0505]TDL43815.1 AI-2E family transporter [Microbacterium oleivorans]